MSATRAVIRLWVVGSAVWIPFWVWNDATKCVRATKSILFCPTASGDTLLRTDYPHVIYLILGPPLGTFIAGIVCWWAIGGVQNWLAANR